MVQVARLGGIVAVSFDAAGTLFAPAEPVGETYARFAARGGIRASSRSLARGFREAFTNAPPLAFPGLRPAARRRAERGWWRRLVGETLDRAGTRAPGRAVDAVFAELFAHYARAEAWRVFPDVRPALRSLRASGLRLAVVSNFDGRLRRLLRDLSLSQHFHAVVISSECGAAKPDPRIFAAALTALGSTPGTTLHIGDSERLDVRGARRAGLRAIRIDRGADSPRPLAGIARRIANRPGRGEWNR